jgi:hypothetical protein
MIGGTDGAHGLSEVDAYDTRTKQWRHATDLPTPRAFLGVAVGLDGRIYTMGGTPGAFYDLTSAEAYDEVTQRWVHLADLPMAREGLAAAAGADGRIYAIGGTQGGGDSRGPSYSVVDAYEPQTNQWQAVAPLRTPRQYLAAVRGPDGRIYAIGGAYTAAGLTTMEAYGPVIYLAPQSIPGGGTAVLTGTSFAASATVSVTWGAAPGGPLLGTGQTDKAGNLLHNIRIVIPQHVRPGQYAVTAEDNRSRYPVTAALSVVRLQAP